jgi:hypothetical protein
VGSLKDRLIYRLLRLLTASFPSSPLTTTPLKAFLQQFFLPSTSCLATKKKIIRHTKRKKTEFEETEQTSKPDITGRFNYQTWNLKQL